MNPIQAWFYAIRPKTLSLAATPVSVGLCLAYQDQGFLYWGVAGMTLAAALLIQIGTNLYNDAADHERGTDTQERLGPARATAEGWLSAKRVKQGAGLAFALAFALGIVLVVHGGWPILLLGLTSIAAGYAYTGGPRPIAYSAFGELFVFLFFGLFAVAGTHYLQVQSPAFSPWPAGFALGLLAAAVLTVNNYRDLDTDRRAGKLTLSHRLERRGSKRLYALTLLLPFLLPLTSIRLWPVLAALPLALLLVRRFYTALAPPAGAPALNRQLAATAGLQLGFGLLMCIALLW